MPNPVEFLLSLHPYIRKGGVLFVEVPSFGNDAALSINHPIAFTRMTLREILWKGDFLVEAVIQAVVDAENGRQAILQAYARKL
jgi:hypothetical protein